MKGVQDWNTTSQSRERVVKGCMVLRPHDNLGENRRLVGVIWGRRVGKGGTMTVEGT